MTKYIIIAGSIMSGLGKGILSASVSKILQKRGYKVLPIKFDGYLNVDCGTMNPYRHGEVFVLDDGGEVDMDFGTYERFLNINMTKQGSITGGKIFKRIIEKERKGLFLGRDVQIIPDLTNEIKNWIREYGKNADIVVIEVGGTIGDLENAYFLEAMRQLIYEEKDTFFIQLTYVPSIFPGEQKTKPTQHSTRILLSMGIQPDLIIAREQEPLSKEAKEKIKMFCNVKNVLDNPLVSTIYELPLILEKQGLYGIIKEKLNLKDDKGDWSEWESLVKRIKTAEKEINVGIVGKYVKVKDAYASIYEALDHVSAHLNVKIKKTLIDSENYNLNKLNEYDALIIPGGFGNRGIEGKINAIKFARENKIPILGICLGLQLMVIEYARNVLGLDANSTEFDPNTKDPVIFIMPEQKNIKEKGGTMRLGAYPMYIRKDTLAYKIYSKDIVYERHRHRYEVNPDYVRKLEENGLVVSATNKKGDIVEMVEYKTSFGIATQAHPELKSRFEKPAPLFMGLIKAALERKG